MSSTPNEPTQLDYFISTKGNITVIALVGPMKKGSDVVFDKCCAEIQDKPDHKIAISLHDVSAVDYAGIADFTRFQSVLRERHAQIRVCFVKPDHKKLLEERGAIRGQELSSNLLDALKSFASTSK